MSTSGYPVRPYSQPLTEEAKKVIELAQSMHQIDIARKVGISRQRVSVILLRWNLTNQKKRNKVLW